MAERKFDLIERTANLGEAVIYFCRNLAKDHITIPIVSQLVRSSTSIGANYCEADSAESRKDFVHKIGICKKEAKETQHWLRMMKVAIPNQEQEIEKLWHEAYELQLIFVAVVRSCNLNDTIKNKN